MSARTAAARVAPSKVAPKKASTASSKETSSKKASGAKGRAKLKLVDKKALASRTRRRMVVLGSLTLLVVGMFGTALAHAQLVEGQRELDTIRADIGELDGQRATLEARIVNASSPESIVFRARLLGMVRANHPQYLVAVRNPSGS